MEEGRTPQGMTYAQAGVDIDATARLVDRIKAFAESTHRPEVLAGVGPFSGLFRLGEYRDPVLVASADDVGTKVKLAAVLGRYSGAGVDLVNHCVNDILTAGAEPLFFLDYLGSSSLSDEARAAIVQGVASACRDVGCALLGGQTADMPDLYPAGDFDLVGFIVGIVERDGIIDGSAVSEGDTLLGLPSSGLHTNGYSLVRRVFSVGVGGDPDEERARLDRIYSGLEVTLGEALLAPHRCYYNEVKPVLGKLKGIAHITGGGIPGNVSRILPEGLGARFKRGAWPIHPVFDLIQREGGIAKEEMYRTFNMGLGLVVVCALEDVAAVRQQVPEALVVGEVVPQTDEGRVLVK